MKKGPANSDSPGPDWMPGHRSSPQQAAGNFDPWGSDSPFLLAGGIQGISAYGLGPVSPGPHLDALLQRTTKTLPSPIFPVRGPDDRLDGRFGQLVVDCDLEADLSRRLTSVKAPVGTRYTPLRPAADEWRRHLPHVRLDEGLLDVRVQFFPVSRLPMISFIAVFSFQCNERCRGSLVRKPLEVRIGLCAVLARSQPADLSSADTRSP